MEKWQYRVRDYPGDQVFSDMEDMLDTIGQDGWELVSMTPKIWKPVTGANPQTVVDIYRAVFKKRG